jgi:hypothetical protein
MPAFFLARLLPSKRSKVHDHGLVFEHCSKSGMMPSSPWCNGLSKQNPRCLAISGGRCMSRCPSAKRYSAVMRVVTFSFAMPAQEK